VQCPKCKHPDLHKQNKVNGLVVEECPSCEGLWINCDEYENWQGKQQSPYTEKWQGQDLDHNFPISEYDAKAALCPECRRYLSRAKIPVEPPFYVERCPQCNGIWCDGGEWNVLEKIGLHYHLERLFSIEWQTQVKEYQSNQKERKALIDKMGIQLATQIFDLAAILQNHPNGDFGVAYLMRQISESEVIKEAKKQP
jgi:Zn-finger nucleic acid-binding protein